MKQASDCFCKFVTKKLTTIFWYSETNKQSWSIHWILLDVLFSHSTKFQYFLYGFKSQLSNSYDNWYVQKYLKGIFHKGMLLIWKEYFTCAILSFSSPRCAINVIYTTFRRAIIAQLNKICRAWACARTIARHSRPGLVTQLGKYVKGESF